MRTRANQSCTCWLEDWKYNTVDMYLVEEHTVDTMKTSVVSSVSQVSFKSLQTKTTT